MVLVIIIVLVIVVVGVGGAATYYLTLGGANMQGGTTTRTTISIGTSSTNSVSQGGNIKTYSGTFQYTIPLGPTGDRFNNKTNQVDSYQSEVTASGSFTFQINQDNYTGTGHGQGTISDVTTGYCIGQATVPYSISIQANDILNGNVTVGFFTMPLVNLTVSISCTDVNGNPYSSSWTNEILPVYPNLVSTKDVPVTLSATLTGGISYTVTIKQD